MATSYTAFCRRISNPTEFVTSEDHVGNGWIQFSGDIPERKVQERLKAFANICGDTWEWRLESYEC